MGPSRTRTWWMMGLALTLLSCGPDIRRFPLRAPVWEDPDRNHVPKRPSEYYSGLIGDFVDQTLLRPLTKFFWFTLPGEARNVNAVDEVPNSSWFTNRIGLFPMTPAEVARGPCTKPRLTTDKGPWVITGAKTDGANPGFFVKTPQGRYLMKFDGIVSPQRPTAADVIGSRIWWSAGYYAPCNTIVYFKKDILRIGPKAKAKDHLGRKKRLTWDDVNKVLRKGFRLKGGLIRATASQFVSGRPMGPFRYEGTRRDDPNDVIPHQDRRELRAMRLLSAWINHVDSREQNSLDVWTKRGGRTFITHYKIDWGDGLGARWPRQTFTRRMGHSYYFDFWHILGDFLTLGIVKRPWERSRMNPDAHIFAYFGVKGFVASRWKPGYPNPAYQRMTFSDALWMVRIISRFSDAHIRAIVGEARLRDQRAKEYLIRTLIGRRDRILKEYLGRYAGLDRFRVVRRRRDSLEQSLCFEDLAVRHGAVKSKDVFYRFRFMAGKDLKKRIGWLQFRPDPSHPDRSCVVLPIGPQRPHDLAPRGARDDHPLRYGILKIFISTRPEVPPTSSMWLHFYDLGPKRGYRLVGMHRQPKPIVPGGW